MGKTNLLDAIYYLCVGRSYFGGRDRIIVRKAEEVDFFRLEGSFQIAEKAQSVVMKVMPGKRKEIEHNRVTYQKLSEHIGKFPVVMSTPFDVALALEGSEERRKFMDNTLSQMDQSYLLLLIAYNKLLSQRNAALKRFAETRRFDEPLLNIYNEQLLPLGTKIHARRVAFVADLKPLFRHFYTQLCDQSEVVDIQYVSQLTEQSFAELLLQARERDGILQRTTKGVHKDDLAFRINELPLKKFASQGQLKSFILALQLSQYQLLKTHKQVKPLLLLDDLFDRLDEKRVAVLMELVLSDEFGQVFITDTHPNRLTQLMQDRAMSFQQFQIERGRVIQTASDR